MIEKKTFIFFRFAQTDTEKVEKEAFKPYFIVQLHSVPVSSEFPLDEDLTVTTPPCPDSGQCELGAKLLSENRIKDTHTSEPDNSIENGSTDDVLGLNASNTLCNHNGDQKFVEVDQIKAQYWQLQTEPIEIILPSKLCEEAEDDLERDANMIVKEQNAMPPCTNLCPQSMTIQNKEQVLSEDSGITTGDILNPTSSKQVDQEVKTIEHNGLSLLHDVHTSEPSLPEDVKPETMEYMNLLHRLHSDKDNIKYNGTMCVCHF